MGKDVTIPYVYKKMYVLAGCGHRTTADYCLRNGNVPGFEVVDGTWKLTMKTSACASCRKFKARSKLPAVHCRNCAEMKPYGNEGGMRCEFRKGFEVKCGRFRHAE